MTLPAASNFFPALRARLAAILAPFPPEVAEVLAGVAEQTARSHVAVYGHYVVYGGDFPIDREKLAREFGRAASDSEVAALSACIRAHIEAGAEPAPPYRAPHAAACAALVAITAPSASILWAARGKPAAEQEAARAEVARLDTAGNEMITRLGWTRADLDAEAGRVATEYVTQHRRPVVYGSPVAAMKPVPFIPEPPTHPSPAEMAEAAYPKAAARLSEEASWNRRAARGAYQKGVAEDRARLRALLLDLAGDRIERANAVNDPAPRDMSAAIEAAEYVGEARAMREFAAGLK